jgi:hypothetical protein
MFPYVLTHSFSHELPDAGSPPKRDQANLDIGSPDALGRLVPCEAGVYHSTSSQGMPSQHSKFTYPGLQAASVGQGPLSPEAGVYHQASSYSMPYQQDCVTWESLCPVFQGPLQELSTRGAIAWHNPMWMCVGKRIRTPCKSCSARYFRIRFPTHIHIRLFYVFPQVE